MKIHKIMITGLVAAAILASQPGLTMPNADRASNVAAPSAVTAASPQEAVEFSVYLPLRNQPQLEELLVQLHDQHSALYHQWLQPAEFLQRFGPTLADVAAVRSSLSTRGFTIVSSTAHGVRVRGPASAVTDAFGAHVQKQSVRGRERYLVREALHLPSELAGIDLRLIGLESAREHHVNSHVAGKAPDVMVDNRYGPSGSYWFDDLKQAYDYPAYGTKTDGSGVSVAVLMADLIYPGDVAAAFNHEKFTAITGKPAPSVSTVLIDGGGVVNGYGSLEAALDTQQVLGGAPGSSVTLVSVPDLSDQSIIDGYTYIVDSNLYDIVNSSFGECELAYTAAFNGGTDITYILKTEHEIYAQGNAQGITFVASSGDEGGLICPSPGYGFGDPNPTFMAGVSTPASDPDVTSVGGGNLITATVPGSLSSAYVRESAFGDPEVPYDIYGIGTNVSGGYWGAGGGVSALFAKPLYQALAVTGSRTARTLPDVGMQVGGLAYSNLNSSVPFCDPAAISCSPDGSSVLLAYGVGVGGGFYFVIGTSVSSPEFVGALALFEQQFGKHHRAGNVNYFLYAAGAVQTVAGGLHAPSALQFFRRNIPGYDGLYSGGFPSYNYDYIYGLGSPDVRKLFGLTAYPAAGVPQTPSNP